MQSCVVLILGLSVVTGTSESPRPSRSGAIIPPSPPVKCATIPDVCNYMTSFSFNFKEITNNQKNQADEIKKLQGMIADMQSSFADLAELTRRSASPSTRQSTPETQDPDCAKKPPLRISATPRGFCLNGQKFHITGAIGPFATFPTFGNNAYRQSRDTVHKWMQDIKSSGGNTLSLLIGFNPPEVTKVLSQPSSKIEEYSNSILKDINAMLVDASKEKIFIQLIVFSSAVQDMEFFLQKDPIVQRFTESILSPIVQKLKGNPTISSWVIFSNPEDFLDLDETSIKLCTDPESLKRYSPMIYKSKTRTGISLLQLQKVTNWIADAMHNADENAMLTVQSLSLATITNSAKKFLTTNYFSDDCLKSAGNRQAGYLDFYQSKEGSYPDKSRWFSVSPFMNKFEEYQFNKPIIIVTEPEAIVSGSRFENLWVTLAQQGYSGNLGGSYRTAAYKEKINTAMQAVQKAVGEQKIRVSISN